MMTQLSTAWSTSRAFLEVHVERLRSAARDQDRGASAVELAVITAVILGIAIALLVVIGNFVTGESNQIHG